MARRNHVTLILLFAVAALVFVSFTLSRSGTGAGDATAHGEDTVPDRPLNLEHLDSILSGGAIAPKLGNETAKQELGRASWKLLHTMMARFPEQPSPEDSLALKTYIALFARLYPCGECAGHFQKLLQKFPPQTSSRIAAAGWACHVHNQVNERLHKDVFDCSKIGDFYDCGCAEEDGGGKEGGRAEGGGGGRGGRGENGREYRVGEGDLSI